MRVLLFFIPFLIFGFDFKKEYKNGNFTRICRYGYSHFQEIKHNEDILSLVGFACVKRDYFIYLPPIINQLKYSKKSRQNSIYFSLLFFNKKLLQSYMLDNLDLSYYRLPLIEHPLSIVVTKIIDKKFQKDGDVLIIKYKNLTYKVYKNSEQKVFIDIYENNSLKESHWYR
jgi:hypothetical protein